ncbi:MAG: hypothetical protein IKN91_01255 [Paludibacteraceae bacterium]|nr:hypothetical protein [Paludibacteraceae bacterium]
MKRLSFFIAVLLSPIALIAQTLAFPGAEGFGKYASGGRGGKVVTVTSLADYTKEQTPIEGTLRWALEQYVSKQTIDGKEVTIYEPLTIVFNVAGNIELLEDLKVKRDNLTIAGQTAPGQGVCITGRSMTFNGATGGEMWYHGPRRKNVIIRYMRFRPTTPTEDNKYIVYGTDIENYENVILDHCTMTWANEECLAIYDTKNTTVQYCIVAEGLYKANHPKGTRSYCGVWGGQFASYHHNLIAHNDSRNVRFNGARAHDTIAVIDYYNNTIYNWGTNNSAYGLEIEIKTPQTRNELNMVNNYYKHGPATGYNGQNASQSNKINRLVRIDQNQATIDEGYTSHHYIEGNFITNYPEISADNWYCGVQFNVSTYNNDSALAKQYFQAKEPSLEVQSLNSEIESAQNAYLAVLEQAGACAPYRDWQDSRIIRETQQGTAMGKGSKGKDGIIDNPIIVGGWPTLEGTPYTDTDHDGIPDSAEVELGLNPNDSTDGSRIADNGYSNLENYINNIPQDLTLKDAPTIDVLQQVQADETIKIHNNTIYSQTPLQQINIYNYQGQLVSTQTFQQPTTQTQLNTTLKGLYLVEIMLINHKKIVQNNIF